MKQFLLFLGLFIGAFFNTYGQPDSTKVLEIPAIYPENNYLIQSLGKEGLLLTKSEKSPILSSNNNWTFIRLDTNFQLLDSTTISISPKLYLVGRSQDKGVSYSLFYNYKKDELQVLALSTKTLQSKIHHLFTLKKLLISSFVVVDGHCFVTGMLRRIPIIFHFDLNQKNPRVKALSASLTRKTKISAISISRQNQEIYITVMHQKYRHFVVKVKTFALQTATLKHEYTVYDGKEPIIFDAKLKTVGNKHLFSGVYASTFRALPEGFFVAQFDVKADNQKTDFFKFYKFTDLENFFNYLPKKQQNRIKDSKKDLNYTRTSRVLLRHPMWIDDQLILVGEAYYPVYQQDNPLDPFNTWRTPVRGGHILEGFIYTHGFMITMDEEGELLWDNSIKYNYFKLRNLRVISALKKRGNEWLFYHGRESKFYATSFTKTETPKTFPIRRVPVFYSKDKIRRATRESVFNWYDNYFLASGYRVVRNTENTDDKGKREVFYLAKFKF